ncbi:MAG: GGDEF domain-containing protein [Nocardioides sp.]|uniref:GGDEF domain-containing protein n=1 Tax=Nocardioides sp. TaxID=35761 RepID=UPI0039E4F14D
MTPALRPVRPSRFPALAASTVVIYGLAGVALLLGAAFHTPGKNPAWVLATLGALALALAAYAAIRGRGFGDREAIVFLALYLTSVVGMSRDTHLGTGALSNGLALPMVGIYASWLLPRRAMALFYGGLLAWVATMALRGDGMLTTMAVIIAGQATLMCETVHVLNGRISRLMYTDPLTGALNRAGLVRQGDRMLTSAARRGEPVAAALIDLDRLREVNNTRGHSAGDDLLVRATREWLDAFDGLPVGRIGGDEFVVLLPGHTAAQARRRLGEVHDAATVEWTWGVDELVAGDDLEDLLARADREMYHGKARHEARVTEG